MSERKRNDERERCTNMRYVQVVDQKTGEVTTIGVKTNGDVADCLREALAIVKHPTIKLSHE